MELIKVHDARLIPRELIEQVPSGNADEFYICLKDAWRFKNDFLYAIIDEDHDIKGYVWYQVNMMNMSIFINTISICDEWKNTGKVEEISKLIRNDMVQMGISKVFFLTDTPSFYEKFGMVKTEEVLLMGEFNGTE